MHLLGACQRKLEASRDGLDDDISLLHTSFLQLADCPGYESINYDFIPAGMHYGHSKLGTVVLDVGRGESLDCRHCREQRRRILKAVRMRPCLALLSRGPMRQAVTFSFAHPPSRRSARWRQTAIWQVSSDYVEYCACAHTDARAAAYALIYNFLKSHSHDKAAQALRKSVRDVVVLNDSVASSEDTPLDEIIREWKLQKERLAK